MNENTIQNEELTCDVTKRASEQVVKVTDVASRAGVRRTCLTVYDIAAAASD